MVDVTMRRLRVMLLGGLAVLAAACDSGFDDGGPELPQLNEASCTLDLDYLFITDIRPRQVPVLTSPALTGADGVGDFLADDGRVVGFVVDGQAYAVPISILRRHEIANFNFDDVQVAVTYSPLTGSSLVFTRDAVGGAYFEVSGLLYGNATVLLDMNDQATIWPQLLREGGCGPLAGEALGVYPSLDLTWGGWRALHPDTRVVSSDIEPGFDYTPSGNPLINYEQPADTQRVDYSLPFDTRRPPKERVLGIPFGDGLAVPFGALESAGAVAVVQQAVGGEDVVVFWDAEKEAAAAYRPAADGAADGQALTFAVQDGAIVDTQTGSTWRIDGLATAGPLEGTALERVTAAYPVFWFAWAALYQDTAIWTP